MHELQNAYNNSRNGEIRFYAPWMKQLVFLMYFAPIVQNRCSTRFRKLNSERSLARARSRSKNSQITIVELMMNSCGSSIFWQWLGKTVGEEDVRSTNQEEFSNLVENWRSLDQKSDEDFWENLQFLEGKLVRFLWIVIIFDIQLWLNIYTPA